MCIRDDLEQAGVSLTQARDHVETQLAIAKALCVDAAAAGVSEVQIGRLAHVDRMTVRRWLGKRAPGLPKPG